MLDRKRARGKDDRSDADPAPRRGEADEELDQLDALHQAIAELGQDPNGTGIILSRWESHDNRSGYAYLATIDAAGFDADTVAHYGPGRYRVQIHRGGRFVRTLNFLVGGPARSTLSPSAAAAAPESGGLLEKILLPMLLKSMDTNATIVAAALGGRGGGSSIADLVAVLREAREGANAGQLPAATAVEMLKTGIDLAGQIGEGAPRSEGGGLGDIALRAMPLLERLLTAPPAPARAAAPAANPPARAAQLPAPAAPAAPAQPAVSEPPLMTIARQWVPRMLKEIGIGRSGYTWGSYVAEGVPAEFHPHLAMIAKADPAQRLDLLAEIDPKIREHAEWVNDAAEGIRDTLEPPELESPDDEDQEHTDDADRSSEPAGESAAGGAGNNGDGAHDGGSHPKRSRRANREGLRAEH